jgi:hypothetical protein
MRHFGCQRVFSASRSTGALLLVAWVTLLCGVLSSSLASRLSAETPASASVDISFAANDVAFLNLMGNLEAPRGFDTVSGFAPVPPHRPLTDMTLGEVLAYQERIRAMGTVSSAVGRYQFIYTTLRDLVDRLGIAEDLRFDAEVQTYLARFLMHDCGFYDWHTDPTLLGNCLAQAWAALPLVSGPGAGLSAYAGDGVNAALTTPDRVLGVLVRRFDW